MTFENQKNSVVAITKPPIMKTISPKLLSVPEDISFMIFPAPNTVRKIPSDAKNGNALLWGT